MPGPVGNRLEGDPLISDPGQVLFLYDFRLLPGIFFEFITAIISDSPS